MKRMNFLPMGAAALLLAFVACTDEVAEVPAGELKQIVMTASDFETENGSRTNFQITSSGAEFSWAANDTVGIFPNEGAQAYFPMTSGAGTKSANFTGGGWALKDASTYAAYYPFIGNFYLDKNAIPVDYTGQVQTGDASTAHLGAYDYMAAAASTPKNGNVVFAFKHLGALVQLKLTVPQATTLSSVTLTTESKVFAVEGKVNIMANTLGITSVTSSKELTLEVKNVTTTEANQVVTLYMMIPPVDLSNKTLKAVVKTSAGSEEVALDSKNFLAGKAYALSGSLKDPNGGAIAGNGTYKDGVVSIATAGTMKKLLGDDYLNITSLKVVGPINGDDVYYLRKMLGGSNFSEADWGKLTTLDLSEATIVEGGEWYMQYPYDESIYYYTEDNIIGLYMFYGCCNLQKIVLSNNITKIGDGAFINCSSLSSVTIPNGILGQNAFSDCDALTSVALGEGVTEIGTGAFSDCDALISITTSDNISNIGSSAFRGCDALTTVVIPKGLIDEYAFTNCKSLKNIVLGDGVFRLEKGAFRGCTMLSTITIGNNLNFIGENAFKECTAINSVYISDLYAWLNIDFNVFGTMNGENPLCYGSKLYLNNNELKELIIPEGISEIQDYAFFGCTSIVKVTIGDYVTSIGLSAFRNCTSLSFITIPDNVILLGSEAFRDCTSLNSAIIGNGITSLSSATFRGCSSLTSVIIGKNVTEVGSHCFYNVRKIECYCYATIPPTLGTYILYYPDFVTDASTLYVPTRCGSTYKTSEWGQYFTNIKEID